MVSINLLPPEFRLEEVKRARFVKVQTIGIGVVLLVIFLTSLVVALRILQSQKITQIQTALTQSEQKISDLKTTQASLLLLKDRLATINQYLGMPSKQSQSYTLIIQLLPASAALNSISVDITGQIIIIALVPDSFALEELITNLTSKDINQDKISQVAFESINRSIDGSFRLNFKVSTN